MAAALNAAGHDAVLAAPAASGYLTTPFDIHFVPTHETWDVLATDPLVRRALESNYRGLRGKKLLVQLMGRFRQAMTRVLDDIATMPGYGADLVVSHPILPGRLVSEELGVPCVTACLEPAWVPTSSFTNPVLPFRLPRALNRASYRATDLWIRGFVGNGGRWPRRPGSSASPYGWPGDEHSTVLHAFSRHILPAGTDYPDWVRTTGFWFLPEVPAWVPPRDLVDYLRADEPPVYIGFGSLLGLPPALARTIVGEAVRRAGVRAVVTGLGDDRGADPTGHLFYVGKASFDWLFPRVSAIVHHGGSGTSGTALAAGRPQVVCPAAEPGQRFNGWRAHATGVAPPPLVRRDLTPESLAAAIRQAVTDERLAANAEEMRRKIRAENGVSTAVGILESLSLVYA
ncbi:nucleotide disphospho-sugar-binding domain-containing protein [Phytoactinopolyspora halotolerans]|uniref:Glycosyltransferase family 1 protein n=1 Tax=Phytoactinopolyspora halotolerans TaxID=1981512 RepID=A0A6L9SHL9_9ACTN|nr:glycosyltransferase family 1 protein [Phytoactinopolyspora halotolerans]